MCVWAGAPKSMECSPCPRGLASAAMSEYSRPYQNGSCFLQERSVRACYSCVDGGHRGSHLPLASLDGACASRFCLFSSVCFFSLFCPFYHCLLSLLIIIILLTFLFPCTCTGRRVSAERWLAARRRCPCCSCSLLALCFLMKVCVHTHTHTLSNGANGLHTNQNY